MDVFLSNIKKSLKEPLPGYEAHLKLFPESRRTEKPGPDKTDAGVLLLIYPDKNNNLHIPFIKRPPESGPHSSQISFPGGKYEKDDYDLKTTALRETQEEVGVDSSSIKIIEKLTKLYIPISKYLVHPYVGYTSITPVFNADRDEVDYIITYPILELVSLSIKERIFSQGKISYKIPYYDIQNEIVWGATSMILSEFIEIIKKSL